MKRSNILIFFAAFTIISGIVCSQVSYDEPVEKFIKNRNKIRQLIREYLQRFPYMVKFQTDNKIAYVFHLGFKTDEYLIEGERKNMMLEGFKEGFTYKNKQVKDIEKIEVYGHTDLQWYKEKNVTKNQELGIKRRQSAVKALKEFTLQYENSIPPKVRKLIFALKEWWVDGYHEHFFLGQCNKIMDNKMLNGLNYNEIVDEIVKKIRSQGFDLGKYDLDNPIVVKQLRKDKKLQGIIYNDLEYYREKFKIFRCIVIFAYYKEDCL